MDQERFESGMSFADYLAHMPEARREGFVRSYQAVQLAEEDRQTLAAMTTPLFLAAFSEDWCGDCRINVPVAARLAEACPALQLRCFSREANSDLALQFKLERIPTLILFNHKWQEIGRWVERPQAMAEVLAQGDGEQTRLARIAYNQGHFHADTIEELLDLLHG